METKMAAAKQYIDNQGLNRTMQYGNFRAFKYVQRK